MPMSISVGDADLKTALHFMISTVTILEEMIIEMTQHPTLGVNYSLYKQKIEQYEPTYNGMMDDFYDNIFGEYTNRISRHEFLERLSHSGWKYFTMRNLNELFANMVKKHGKREELD